MWLTYPYNVNILMIASIKKNMPRKILNIFQSSCEVFMEDVHTQTIMQIMIKISLRIPRLIVSLTNQ